uniref:Uncharacterized protein n=1 Tax=Anguilla anguilla TaxID=7936 RepID=A0A0E9QRI1_ANGAN
MTPPLCEAPLGKRNAFQEPVSPHTTDTGAQVRKSEKVYMLRGK